VVALDADLVLDTGLIPFQNKFPDRFFECGIAEQDMVSQAGGMALSGLIPVVHSFACFLTARANEQIYNNCTERTKIIYVGTLAGAIPGGPGHSHQGVRDISAMAAMPGITVVEPSCEDEVHALLNWSVEKNAESSYIRLTSLPVQTNFTLPSGYVPIKGQGVEIIEGSDAVIVTYGPQMLTNAVSASFNIKEVMGLAIGVINFPWLNFVDVAWLSGKLSLVPHVICIDNHYSVGALSDRFAIAIANDSKISASLTTIGLTDIPICGTNDEILNFHGLSVDAITSHLSTVLQGRV
jgi:transketolase